jgi:hypothetical protein
MSKIVKTVEDHLKMADKILESIHHLALHGTVSLTDGPWDYDWCMLESCIDVIQKLKIVKCCEADTVYNGYWTVKTADCTLIMDHETVEGTVTLSRSGLGLDEYHWNWKRK